MDSNGNKYRRKAVSITILIITSLTGIRIHLQDVMQHLSRNPCDEDVKQIQHLQDSLCAQFAMLDQSQLEMSRSSRLTVIPHDDDTFSQFDDLDDECCLAMGSSGLLPANISYPVFPCCQNKMSRRARHS